MAELREAEGAPPPRPDAGGGAGAPPSPRAAAAAAAAFDEKNIRRRVYDALNVLMALNIIVKDRKQITWRGLPLPGGGSRVARLRAERDRLRAAAAASAATVADLARQAAAFRGLVLRNAHTPASVLRDAAAAAGDGAPPPPTPLPLPFILLAVRGDAAVEVQISDDNRSAGFDFRDAPFRVVGGEDVLYALGLDGGADGAAVDGAATTPAAPTPAAPTPAAATPRRGAAAAPTPPDGDAMLASPAPAARRRSGARRAATTPRGKPAAAVGMEASPAPQRAASPAACGGASRPARGRAAVAWPVA